MPLVIDPEGLFYGDRMARLTDMARLYWPYLFLASNGYGRLEINFAKITSKAFATFRKPPSVAELRGILEEYFNAYLLFLYKVNGQVWGQWDTSAKFLPRYHTAQDEASPAPPAKPMEEWRDRYITSKQAESAAIPTDCNVFENGAKNFANVLHTRRARAVAVAVAVAVKTPSPLSGVGQDSGEPVRSPEAVYEQQLEATARTLHGRHPAIRRCGLGEARSQLKAILSKYPISERIDRLVQIDRNHAAWCATEEWRKDGGKYAKGLNNWLAPTKGRWDLRPALNLCFSEDDDPMEVNRRRDQELEECRAQERAAARRLEAKSDGEA